jgi:hypothetical protein
MVRRKTSKPPKKSRVRADPGTTSALTVAEQNALIAASKSYRHPSGTAPFDAYAVVLWFLKTGTHPAVLARPVDHLLQAEIRASDGLPVVSWNRPKKKGLEAHCEVLLDPSDSVWVLTFYRSVMERPFTTKTYRVFFRELGRQAHLTRTVTSRTMRHTFGANLARLGYGLYDICRKMSIGIGTANTYLRLYGSMDREVAGANRGALPVGVVE